VEEGAKDICKTRKYFSARPPSLAETDMIQC
jgi:hypothetical protein